jgi:cytoskeletal protein CcmA (bactofilin family)
MFEFKKGSPEKAEDAPWKDAPPADKPAAAPAEAARPRVPPPAPPAASGPRREAATVGASIQLDGDLRGQEDLLVEGEVNGTIQLRNNTLTIGTQGKIRAHVFAKEIHVEGVVEGDLYASERITVRRSAQVRGNITAPRVTLEEGARFKGSIEMDSEAVEASLGKGSRPHGGSPAASQGAPRPAQAEQQRDKPAPAPGTPARSGATS